MMKSNDEINCKARNLKKYFYEYNDEKKSDKNQLFRLLNDFIDAIKISIRTPSNEIIKKVNENINPSACASRISRSTDNENDVDVYRLLEMAIEHCLTAEFNEEIDETKKCLEEMQKDIRNKIQTLNLMKQMSDDDMNF